MKRVAIFVDGSNLYHTQRKLGWRVDYAKILERFRANAHLYNAFYYTGVDAEDWQQGGFLPVLVRLGYTVRTKQIKVVGLNEAGEPIRKANLDVELVLDLIATCDNWDHVVLFSGDGDFERAVEVLRSRGKIITVVSTESTIALELRNAADRYIELDSLRDALCLPQGFRSDNPPPARPDPATMPPPQG